MHLAAQDSRFRRIALNHLFEEHLAAGLLCLVPFEDHEILVDPRDDKIAFTLMSGRAWQRDDLKAAIAHVASAGRLKPNGVYLDVGANIGTTVLYATLTNAFAHAIAIEPEPANRQILERNIAINTLFDRVTIVGAAASSARGEMTLHRDRKNRGAHSLEPGFVMSPAASTAVAVDTLDNIVKQEGHALSDVAFIKIDVEGHERSVLAGAPELLAHAPPIMIEATFAAGDSDAANADYQSLRSYLPNRYTTCVEIGGLDGKSKPPKAQPLDDFQPRSMQHELLIY